MAYYRCRRSRLRVLNNKTLRFTEVKLQPFFNYRLDSKPFELCRACENFDTTVMQQVYLTKHLMARAELVPFFPLRLYKY